MAKKRQRTVVSCYECAGLYRCYHTKTPDISRDKAREIAARCRSLHKGLTTETIRIQGKERGLSRKKAEKLITRGRAVWVDQGLIYIVNERA